MSRENVEIIRRAFEAFRTNDLEAWLATISPNINVFPNPREPGAKPHYEGREGVLEYLRNWYAGWDEYVVEPTQFVEAGDYVVVAAREIGTAKQSGIRVEQEFSHVFRLRDGQTVEWRQFGPLSEALEAVGLSE
ncbi:MAG: nuclear transport factor 2 family protein [Thermoleophilaceae bacterium]